MIGKEAVKEAAKASVRMSSRVLDEGTKFCTADRTPSLYFFVFFRTVIAHAHMPAGSEDDVGRTGETD
jgi:hypothetical protein